jgi:hypothetical protein
MSAVSWHAVKYHFSSCKSPHTWSMNRHLLISLRFHITERPPMCKRHFLFIAVSHNLQNWMTEKCKMYFYHNLDKWTRKCTHSVTVVLSSPGYDLWEAQQWRHSCLYQLSMRARDLWLDDDVITEDSPRSFVTCCGSFAESSEESVFERNSKMRAVRVWSLGNLWDGALMDITPSSCWAKCRGIVA